MRSPKKKPFSVSRKFSKYKVTNWSKYNKILRNRGRIDFMMLTDLSDGWYENEGGNKKRGGQRRYRDKAILMHLQRKKLHIATGDNGLIIEAITTSHSKDDRSQVEALLVNVNTLEVIADPGYDGKNIYQMLRAKGIKPTIRPPNQLVAKKAKTERQQGAAYKQTKGYQAWRTKNNYGRRELVENTFFRFKNSFGSKFLSRGEDNMKNEITIKCHLLNKMFEIGKPISMRVA